MGATASLPWDVPSWGNLTETYEQVYASHSVHTYEPTNFIEKTWMDLVSYYGDFKLLVAFYFFMNACYVLSGALFWVIDRYHLMPDRKIQVARYPTNLDYFYCIVNLVQNYVIIIYPLLYIGYPIFTALNFTTALPLPSLFTFCWQFFVFVLCEDVTHYFLHRLLHTKLLYKSIHKIHHVYSAPFGLCASYAHPLEVLILGFATFSGPMLVKPHYLTFYAWVWYRQMDAVMTHCGYNLPGLADYIPFYGGTPAHDYHHKTFIWNYSSRFTFMDKFFGTFKEDAAPTSAATAALKSKAQ